MGNPILVLFPLEVRNKLRHVHGKPKLGICPICRQVYRRTSGVETCSSACRIQRNFWGRVEKTETCWLWRGAISKKTGYGRYSERNKHVLPHRYAYELLIGAIPDGLHLDHLCRVRICVRPDHLEPVTPRENTLRSENFIAHLARKTHCVRGHPFDEENTGIDKRRNGRVCLTCKREESNRRYHDKHPDAPYIGPRGRYKRR